MLTAIILTDANLRDALVSFVSGIKQTHENQDIVFYQKNANIFAFSPTLSHREIFEIVLAEFQPEKVFFAEIGRSIDVDHEIGDVILPNIFFEFDKNLREIKLDASNRDSIVKNPQFLEIFEEQKDYYVEDFGLSIGGIVVSETPNNPDLNEKLMMAYEADAYSEKNFAEIAKIISENIIPSVLLIGITEGKSHKTATKPAFQLVAENMITTTRLISEEDSL